MSGKPLLESPDFFVVGAPKSGTTALDRYLGAHPEIFMALQKESHHFAADLTDEDDKFRPREAYLSLFRGAAGARRIGESSVMYLYSRQAAKRIAAFRPDAQIIAMLRNPVTMIPSLHAQNVFNGHEPELDLEIALDEEDSRLREMARQKSLRIPQRVLYRKVADYGPQLERYFEVFGRDRVRVVLYEEFASDVAKVYRGILKFLDVDPEFSPPFPVVNARKTARFPLITMLLNRPPRWLRVAWRGLGLPMAFERRLRAGFVRLNTRETSRQRLQSGLIERLRADMAPSITKLETLLNRDLGIWREKSVGEMPP